MEQDNKLTIYLAVGMVTAGFVLMFIAWNEAASLDYVQGQVPYLLSGTIPGLALTLTGLTLALVQELRRIAAQVTERLGAVAPAPSAVPAAPTAFAAAPVTAPVAPAAAAPAAPPAPIEGEHVVATASTFHEPDCHIVAGRNDLTPLDADAAADRGLTPCRICEPATAVAA